MIGKIFTICLKATFLCLLSVPLQAGFCFKQDNLFENTVNAHAVFIGRAIEVERGVYDANNYSIYDNILFEVDYGYKNIPASMRYLYIRSDMINGQNATVGEKYIVFAHRLPGGGLGLLDCPNLTPARNYPKADLMRLASQPIHSTIYFRPLSLTKPDVPSWFKKKYTYRKPVAKKPATTKMVAPKPKAKPAPKPVVKKPATTKLISPKPVVNKPVPEKIKIIPQKNNIIKPKLAPVPVVKEKPLNPPPIVDKKPELEKLPALPKLLSIKEDKSVPEPEVKKVEPPKVEIKSIPQLPPRQPEIQRPKPITAPTPPSLPTRPVIEKSEPNKIAPPPRRLPPIKKPVEDEMEIPTFLDF